jgi:hypothetical protein
MFVAMYSVRLAVEQPRGTKPTCSSSQLLQLDLYYKCLPLLFSSKGQHQILTPFPPFQHKMLSYEFGFDLHDLIRTQNFTTKSPLISHRGYRQALHHSTDNTTTHRNFHPNILRCSMFLL